MALPAKFLALVDGPTDSGTPTDTQPAYMLTRPQTERLVKAAYSVVMVFDIELTGLQRDVVLDLKAALAEINIDL